nr:NADH dehydrogenase subunit 2 [Acostemma sp.]
MNKNSSSILLLNTMVIGVTMTICSNNWLSMWSGMEMSMLSIIPLMHNKKSMSSESSMKYFIVQSMSSMMFMLSVVSMLIGVSMQYEIIMTIAMSIKIALAPFHSWILYIIEGLEYYPIILLITIMKIPPLTIISYMSKELSLMSMTSMIIGSTMCLNQSSLRKIITYSSIFNMGMISSIIKQMIMWTSFIMIYSVMLTIFIMTIKFNKINFMNQMVFNKFNMYTKTMLWINLLSMGGFPPLMGFINKLIVIQFLIMKHEFIQLFIMSMSSLMVMFFYIRLTYISMMVSSITQKWNKKSNEMNLSLFSMNLLATPMMFLFKSLL